MVVSLGWGRPENLLSRCYWGAKADRYTDGKLLREKLAENFTKNAQETVLALGDNFRGSTGSQQHHPGV